MNGEAQDTQPSGSGMLVLRRTWGSDTVHLTFPKALTTVALPDEPDTCAFMDGPIVLAGLNPGRYSGRGADERTRQLHREAQLSH